MSCFKRVALVRSHQIIPTIGREFISDLVELASLAAAIKNQVEDVTIPVGPVDRDSLGAFHDYMKKNRPDLVGISSFTCGINSGLEYARISKKFDACVVMGGYHPTALPEDVLGIGLVDAVVRGEGEVTFRQLIREGPGKDVPGLSLRSGNEVYHTPDRPLIQDLDGLPLPLRTARPPRYGRDGTDYHTDTIYTSRGCRAKCSFCANNLVGKAWRRRSGENILEELLTLVPARKGDPKPIKFWDANFITEVERIDHLCDLILQHRLNQYFTFSAETRLEDVVRARDILGKMYEAGFRRMSTGVESPNRSTHQLLRKGVNLNNVAKAVSLLENHGIRAYKLFIIGHPNESEDEILEYVDYSLSHGASNQASNFFVMTPYPGTSTFANYQKDGLIRSYNWDLYNNFGSVISPNGIPQRRLQALLGSVNAKYRMLVAFQKGRSYPRVVKRMFSYLIMYMKISHCNPEYSDEDRHAISWEIIRDTTCNATRTLSTARTGRFWQRLAIKYYGDSESVLISFQEDASSERLVVEAVPRDGLSAGRRHLHLSVRHVRMLVEQLDVRLLSNLAFTLRFNWRACRPGWVSGLALTIGKLGLVLLSMILFHLGKTLELSLPLLFKKRTAALAEGAKSRT